MPGYFGTESQQRLQQKCEELDGRIAATPGLCQVARMSGTDDPERIGWDFVFNELEQDGVFGFRMIPAGQAAAIDERLTVRGYRWDRWSVYTASPGQALEHSVPIVNSGLLGDYREVALPDAPDSDEMRAIQRCMADCGVAPFSGSMLLGAFGPAATVAIADADGDIVATAHTYLPYNKHSRFHRAAWGGLVAVSPKARGKRLGAYVNARIVIAAVEQLGAKRIDELVHHGNAPSQHMVEACGLRLDPEFTCGAATRAEGRFTA